MSLLRLYPLARPVSLLIGRGWGWDREALAALDRLDPDGFAVVEVDHPTVRWVVVREFALGPDAEGIARILLQRFGDDVAPHGIGHIAAEDA